MEFSLQYKVGKGGKMKYLLAGLIVSSVQILFIIAFTLCALVIGITSLMRKFRPGKISN